MTADTPRPQVPWGLSDARTTFFTTAGGIAALVMAWWGASGTGKQDRQVTWMVVGVAAVIVMGIGNFFWLLAGRRAVGVRRNMLLDALDAALPPSTSAGSIERVVVAGRAASHVTIAGSSRYHAPSCLLVRCKVTTPVDGAARPDLNPCEMCQA